MIIDLDRYALAAGKCYLLAYLSRIIKNHLLERLLWYDTDDGSKEYVVIADVPQGPAVEAGKRKTKLILITTHRQNNAAMIRVITT